MRDLQAVMLGLCGALLGVECVAWAWVSPDDWPGLLARLAGALALTAASVQMSRPERRPKP
jgi:hypothetical protein